MFVLTLVLNKSIPKVMKLKPHQIKHILIMMVVMPYSILYLNYSIKYYSLSLLAVVMNLNPVFTMIMGYMLLSEKVTKLDVVCLFLTFMSV